MAEHILALADAIRLEEFLKKKLNFRDAKSTPPLSQLIDVYCDQFAVPKCHRDKMHILRTKRNQVAHTNPNCTPNLDWGELEAYSKNPVLCIERNSVKAPTLVKSQAVSLRSHSTQTSSRSQIRVPHLTHQRQKPISYPQRMVKTKKTKKTKKAQKFQNKLSAPQIITIIYIMYCTIIVDAFIQV